MPGLSAAAADLAAMGSGWHRDLRGKELGVVKGVDPNLATSMPLMSPGCLHPTRPLTAEAGRRS